ncbi:MAG: twin-arginine translocation signal domain-containing protein [Phycisphaeraceae bacterium]|nr:twin-arginine translocation signal domain-containing protein [Phycisphaeraceae bacterium]MBX3407014.1 twin-arginine translocation signal domain-containing protein [Phycisphaeraceae bacterium]
MADHSRRDFLRYSGLAAAGAATLTLDARAQPTAPSGSAAIGEQVQAQFGDPPLTLTMRDGARPTRRNALGPFYQRGAPFRGKVSPPRAPGTVLVVSGRVWAFDTKRPLPGAIIDLWHCDHEGHYHNNSGEYHYRARIITSETGAYEYETIHPVVYEDNGDLRSPHIHYRITAAGYRTLVTQLFFEGDPRHEDDRLFDPSLMTKVVTRGEPGAEFQSSEFDIVLAPDDGSPPESEDRPRRGRARRTAQDR